MDFARSVYTVKAVKNCGILHIPAARRAPRRRDAFTRRTRKAHEMSDQFAIATLCSAGYVHWLEHLHRNLNLLRLVPLRLTVCVTDRQTRAAARTCVTQG